MDLQRGNHLSVIVPVFLSSSMLEELCKEIRSFVPSDRYSLEIILVDDRSPDQSWTVIRDLCARDPFTKAVRLSRNFGQQIAVSAGIMLAQGNYVIVMDCDFENPPSAIPAILSELELGKDIVYVVADKRNKFKDQLTSRLFWFFVTKILGVPLLENQLMMRGMSSRFVEHYRNYPETVRTVAGISADVGFLQGSVKVEIGKRLSGKGNHSFFARLSLAIDTVLSLSTKPLTLIIFLSSITLVFTLLLSVFYTINFYLREIDPGFTTLVLLEIGLSNVIILLLAVAGTYLANIYKEVRRRPLFHIDERLNFE